MNPDIIGDALIQAFAEQGYQAALDGPTRLVVTLPDGTTGPLDIAEWRAFAGRDSRARLPEHAAAFVRGFAKSIEGRQAQTAQAMQGANRLDEHSEIGRLIAEERLRVRLYTVEELSVAPGMREALLNRPLAPGLLQQVVVDYPDSIMPMNRSSTGDFPENQVFAAALRASIEKEPHYVKTDEIRGVPITHIGETHRYVGSHVNVLARHAGQAPYGALVSFPVPEYLVLHPIGGAVQLYAAMETMQMISRTHVENGEKALSPQVFWWRPGAYERLPEPEALASGLVPDLVPVGVQVDHEQRTIAPQTAETDELFGLWNRDHS